MKLEDRPISTLTEPEIANLIAHAKLTRSIFDSLYSRRSRFKQWERHLIESYKKALGYPIEVPLPPMQNHDGL